MSAGRKLVPDILPGLQKRKINEQCLLSTSGSPGDKADINFEVPGIIPYRKQAFLGTPGWLSGKRVRLLIAG